MPSLRSRLPGLVGAAAISLAAAAAFWLPAREAARGFFPAPLDDVYIHFDFARSLATGSPLEWLPGNGYSSGETAPLYALVLAGGYLIGFRGPWLGAWAALLAVVSVAALIRAVQRLVRPAPRWLAWGLSLLPVSIAVVDWTLFSGMEVAAFVGVLGAALVTLDVARGRAPARGGRTREHWQWRLGALGAALVLLRPEAAVLVAIFALAAARGVGARSPWAALARAGGPAAAALAAVLVANRLATGDTRSAGAQLKLLASNPYLSEVDRARALVENLVTFGVKVLGAELGPVRALGWLLPALALAAVVPRARRAVSSSCLIGAVAWTFVVSLNGNAPFHNFRYYAPAIVLLVVAAAIGLAGLARAKRGAPIAALALVALLAPALPRFPVQTSHFRRSVANIRDQQIEAGLRLARLTPPGARVLLGDAGAIPYVSGRPALDALGLGGYRRMPFARAAVHGEAATVELLERLAPAERPTYLALYPNWFAQITSRFGVEIDRVTIADNVICGGPTKGIYLADWSALADGAEGEPDALDELDVADVVSEAEHAYVAPLPEGGWTTLDVLDDARGARRFDGGRIIPEGKSESFVVRRAPEGPARLRVRVDHGADLVRVHARGATVDLELEPPRAGAWRYGRARVEALRAGDVIVLEAARAAFRDYHVWIEHDR